MVGRPPRSTLLPYPTLSRSPMFFGHQAASGAALRAVAILVRPQGGGEPVWVVVAESKTKRRQVKDQIATAIFVPARSEEHTSELQSQSNLVCRLLLLTHNTT